MTGRRGARARQGFSLLETLLAIAILLGSIAVLGELVRQGLRHAAAARDLTRAQLLAESLLVEIASGSRDGRAVEDAALVDAPGWVYTLERHAGPRPGLVELRLSVHRQPTETRRPTAGFQLVRWATGQVMPGTQQPTDETEDPLALGPTDEARP